MARQLIDITDALKAAPITRTLGDAAIDGLARASVVRRYQRGHMVCSEDEPSQWFYLVCSGRMRVVRYSDDGAELVLSVIDPGGTVGELSVLDGAPRSATVEAIETSDVLCIPNARVREALLASPQSLMAVVAELATMVRRLTGNAADLVFLDLPHRVAKYLLLNAVDHGDGAGHVELAMSQAGIAAQLGVARQTFSTVLNGLARQGLVRIDGRRIDIDDLDALREFLDA